MVPRDPSDRLVLGLAALVLAGAVAIPPGAYFFLSHRYLEGSLVTEAEVTGHAVNALVTANPDLWRFEQVRLEELLQRRPRTGEPELRRVVDLAGQAVAESRDPLSGPLVLRTASILDAGRPVGRVEVARSLRPLLVGTGLLAALLFPLAALAFLLAHRLLRRAAAARLALEERLRQAQRLEAIGRLAGGVAHDFNNLLAAVLGFARELHEELAADAPQRKTVEEILSAAQRGVHVTRSLLAFSRKQVLELRRTDVGLLVWELERLLRSTLGPGQRLRVDLDGAPLPVRVDAVQLEMVLVNLVANARDAMPGGGTLSVTSGRTDLDHLEAAALGLARPGPYVRLALCDSGAGMDGATRQRVFEPFFTTKEIGRGTGLGLAIAYGVLQQHGGAIQVASAPDQGTTVTLLLPLPPPAEAEAEARSGQAGDARPGGQETILLAEDDRSVRKLARLLLQRAGYQVLEASDGEEAVQRFAERRAEVGLVVLDLGLPGRSGPEALEAIRQLTPGVPALFVAGNPPDGALGEGGARLDGTVLLVKPVEPGVLLRAVRQALDG